MKKHKTYYYTDGACSGNPGPGGWAFVKIELIGNSVKVDTRSGNKAKTTNNEMELTAAYYAVLDAYKRGTKDVVIICDSAYVVNAVKMGWLYNWHNNGWETKDGKPIKNKAIWEKFYKLLFERKMNVQFEKVKGHAGEPINEMVDALAVTARKGAEANM